MDTRLIEAWKSEEYPKRVAELVAEGFTEDDAQDIADGEFISKQ